MKKFKIRTRAENDLRATILRLGNPYCAWNFDDDQETQLILQDEIAKRHGKESIESVLELKIPMIIDIPSDWMDDDARLFDEVYNHNCSFVVSASDGMIRIMVPDEETASLLRLAI